MEVSPNLVTMKREKCQHTYVMVNDQEVNFYGTTTIERKSNF